MRVLLYFIVYCSVAVSLFIALCYLMTVIDPGLMDLPAKAVRKMRNEFAGEERTILPPEDYVDFDTMSLRYTHRARHTQRHVAMYKDIIRAIHYIGLLIVVFVIMCVLMTTVNPPQLKDEKPDKGGRRILDMKVTSFFLKNGMPNGPPGYGLAKANTSYVPTDDTFYQYIPVNETKTATRSYLAQRVVPPLWPPYIRNATETTEHTKVLSNVTESTDDNTIFNTTSSPVKGHRRSVEDFKRKMFDKQSGFVVLKIIDKHGRSKIEIKLIPNDLERSDETEKDMSLSMRVQTEEYIDELPIPDDTEIIIMPNDTVVIGSAQNFENNATSDNKNESLQSDSTNTIRNELLNVLFPEENNTKVKSVLYSDTNMSVQKNNAGEDISVTSEDPEIIIKPNDTVVIDNTHSFVEQKTGANKNGRLHANDSNTRRNEHLDLLLPEENTMTIESLLNNDTNISKSESVNANTTKSTHQLKDVRASTESYMLLPKPIPLSKAMT